MTKKNEAVHPLMVLISTGVSLKRNELNMTQRGLASVAGITVGQLRAIEDGKATARIDALLCVMTVLGMTWSECLGFDAQAPINWAATRHGLRLVKRD